MKVSFTDTIIYTIYTISFSLIYFLGIFFVYIIDNDYFGNLNFYLKSFFHFFSFFLCLIGCYYQFSVVHDAAHNIVSGNMIINNIIGRYGVIYLYPAVWYPWKFIHSEHHKYTNNKERDPDYWSTHSDANTLLKCFFQMFNFSYWYFKNSKGRPLIEKLDFYIEVAFYISIPFLFYYFNLFYYGFFFYILPGIVSLMLVCYFFDIMVHSEMNHTPQSDRYKTTTHIDWTNKLMKPYYSMLYQYQDYHLTHHLDSSIPFFRYTKRYDERKELYKEKKISIKTL
eukprot:TRINITY_DN6951_c0_g1_i1.p1 TRINITY_DN6951_c0_g1~~TRINITY_DN6951_c0_g1_i1.p1  ORF type:complete len:297 (-),score=14.78 TRINITY_DN6951_c0_g1_i1:115-960(-)